MNKIQDISGIIFSNNDNLFLDANVWLSIYGPSAMNRWRTKSYSNALLRMRNAKAKLFIDILVLSEFINRYARWEHKQSAIKDNSFKSFRQSSIYCKVAADISSDTKRIVKQCHLCNHSIDSFDINNMLDDFSAGNCDFNDQVINNICYKNGFKLVTDDADFNASD